MRYFTAVLDASVLFSAPLRDLLMRLAARDLYKPKWTELIHIEWMSAILKRRPDINQKQVERTREQMDAFVLDAIVTDFEALIPGLNLPDPNDRHVLAAAIKGQADIIITNNLKDFPSGVLSLYNIQAKHPDTFIFELMELAGPEVLITMRIHRSKLQNPPKTPEEYLATMEKQGLVQTVGFVKKFKDLI
ncbi:MAG: PIN domain-containing protein [Bacteroidia bacterium]|nr:PIN domain-containing protein [Bacteroidia bacterium]